MSEVGPVSVSLYRYDPSTDQAPRYEEFSVPRSPYMRVLDALDYIYETLGHSFGYRWYCGTKRCGTCGVMVNGKPQLACWEPAQDRMVIEPLVHFPVIRDLVVDFSEDEARLIALRPVLERSEPYPGFPEPVTHEMMRAHYELMRCIDCRVCVAACGVLDSPEVAKAFAGPYALVQLAKIAVHPANGRDLSPEAHQAGIEHCLSCNDCVTACPNDVPVLKGAIEPLRELLRQKGEPFSAPEAASGTC